MIRLSPSILEREGLVFVISGPTASGKSSLAEYIAREHNGLVINADSLQLIHALPILTAQPSLEIQKEIPHALYGIYPSGTRVSAGLWLEEVVRVIKQAHTQKTLPIVVGGTGLYLKALLEGLSPMPPVSAPTKKRVEDLFEREGKEGICAVLSQIDPEILEKYIDPQRLKRALEVVWETGKSIRFYQNLPPQAPQFCFHKILIDPDRQTLKSRIKERIHKMLDMGVIEEVQNFEGETYAIGYNELKSHLKGEISLDIAIGLMEVKTSQYAKRQSTWFRNQMSYDEVFK
jgi:tRNA dimethylallyltransferase